MMPRDLYQLWALVFCLLSYGHDFVVVGVYCSDVYGVRAIEREMKTTPQLHN